MMTKPAVMACGWRKGRGAGEARRPGCACEAGRKADLRATTAVLTLRSGGRGPATAAAATSRALIRREARRTKMWKTLAQSVERAETEGGRTWRQPTASFSISLSPAGAVCGRHK